MNLTKPMLCAFASLRKNNNTPIYRAQMLGFKYLYNNQEVVINYLDFTKTSQTTLHPLPFTLYLWLPKIVDPKMKHFNLWHEEKILNLH
jgi:hypothetical protein